MTAPAFPRASDPSTASVHGPAAPAGEQTQGDRLLLLAGEPGADADAALAMQAFFESAAVGTLLLDPETRRFIRVNASFVTIVGYSREELAAMSFSDLLVPAEIVPLEKMLERLANREVEPFVADRQLRRKGGDLIWANLAASMVDVPSGRPIVAIVVQDISARKNSEHEASQLRKRLKSNLTAMTRLHALSAQATPSTELESLLTDLLDATIALQHAAFGVIQLFDRDTETLDIIAQRGFSAEFLETFQSINPLEPFSCARAFHTRSRVIVEDIATDATCVALRPAASAAGFRALQSTPLLNHSGDPLGVLTTYFPEPHPFSEHELKLTDLYARQAAEFIGFRQTENALGQSRGRLAAIFDQAAAGLSETTLDGQFLSVNDELCRMLGRSREELLSLSAFDVTHPDDLERCRAASSQLLEAKGPVSLDKRYVRSDGSIVWANTMLTRLNDSGRPGTVLAVLIDVTARREAERALVESESRFRTLAEASPAMIWFLDADGCHRFANRQFVEFFGRSEHEILGQDWRLVLHPLDADAFLAEVLSCIRERRPFRRHARVRRHDAQWRWTESHALPHFGENGRYLGHVGLSLDITDSLEATTILRENEHQLAVNLSGMTRLQELSTRLVRIGDFHSLLSEILSASAELTGTEKGSIEFFDTATDRLKVVVHQGLGPRFLAYFSARRCLSTWRAVREGVRVIIEDLTNELSLSGSPDLGEFLADDIQALQVTPLVSRDGRLLGMLNNHFRVPHRPAEHELRFLDLLARMAADFIERSQAEQALREGEEKLRHAIEIETVGISFFHTSGLITGANDAFLRMSGYTREDLDNGLIRWDDMTPPQWMPHTLKAMEEFNALGRTIPYEKQYIRKDGTRWWALFSATRLEANEGVEFIIDITERKAADEELRRHRDDLEILVQERTAALDAVNGALRDEIVERQRAEASRQELQRQLASAQEDERRRISRELHDQVGQHITALMLGLNSVHMMNQDAATAVTLASLQAIAETVGKEIHDLALELRPTALDDLGLLRTLSNYIEQWSAQSKIEVDFHSSGWTGERLPAPIETTAYRIVQEALTNILRHAHATRVSLIVDRRPDQVIIIVEDDGTGFDAEMVLQQPQSKRLGLLGMKERAALMDGEVKLESSPGRGTTVFVRIPVPASTSISSHG